MSRPAPIRFFEKVDIDSETGCWLWIGGIDPTGYGRFHLDGTMAYAHRYAHELLVGPIPKAHDVDHLCRVRRCVNPRHLEAVTRSVNLLRGETLAAAHHEGRDCGFEGCTSCARFRRAVPA